MALKSDINLSKKQVATIAEHYGLLLIVLFGSEARGGQRPQSDVDIAILGKRKYSIETLSQISGEFQALCPHRRIDLVDIATAPPLLRYQIFSEGVLQHEAKPHLFVQQQVYADKLYIEAKPLFALQRAYLLDRLPA